MNPDTVPIADDRAQLIFRVALAEAAAIVDLPGEDIVRRKDDDAKRLLVAVVYAAGIYDGPKSPAERERLQALRDTFRHEHRQLAAKIVERLKQKLAPALAVEAVPA